MMSGEVLLQVGGSVLFGFACGSIPFGYLAGLAHKADIRQHGSGNIGFTNVYRRFGLVWALPVLVLDIGKGVVPTAFAGCLGLMPVVVAGAAVLGHVFTPWLGLRGGKGVATLIGVSAFLCPRSLLAGLGLYALILVVTGFISLSSLGFALFLPVLTAFLYPGNTQLVGFAAVMSMVIILRHTANIGRLVARTEPRFGLWKRVFRKEKR